MHATVSGTAPWERWLVGCAAAIVAAMAHADGADVKFPSNEDLRHVRGLSDPRLSPDGKQVLVQVTDATADGGHTHLWVVDLKLNIARQLTVSPAGDKRGEHHGQWLGDGTSILFLAKRTEHTQLYRLPMSGGEAVPYDLAITPVVDASTAADALPPRKAGNAPEPHDKVPIDVEFYNPAPDGRTIALIAKDPETPGEKKQNEEKADAVFVDHDLHGKRLYLLDTETRALTGTSVPPDVDALSWAMTSERLIAIVELPNHVADLGPARSAWLMNRADPQHATRMAGVPKTVKGGSWSPDGARFYLVAQSAGDTPPGYWYLYEWGLQDGSLRTVSTGVTAALLATEPLVGDHEEVIQAADQATQRGYLRFRSGRTADALRFGSPVVTGLHTNAKHTGWVWIGQGADQPPTLYYADQLGHTARALAAPRVPPAQWPSVRREVVQWRNDGSTVEGLLYMPQQAASAKVPLIVDVHGGPLSSWHDSFNPFVAFLLGQGWAVLRPNPRGSTGYGTAFAAANKNDLGGGDFRDIMTGIDAITAHYPIDTDKLALIGYSYGGEIAGFAEGKTQRFKAIVSGAPVIDQQSEYGTEEDSWYDRWYYGLPWLHVEDAWRQSPLSGVTQAKTPFLLIQGENDTTDPLGQSLEMYRALRQMEVPVDMVQYPRDNHGLLSIGWSGLPSAEPWHGFDVRQRIVTFIQAHF
jgi:dipeptidyl aminopeptidase/acylaminoacyl peptidase